VVPCIDELIVSIGKDETIDQMPTYNTLRFSCNEQTVGYSQREFRFHDVVMNQVDRIDEMDIPVFKYFLDAGVSIVKRVNYGKYDDSAKRMAFKDFNNAAMF
jgi:hypothetical protein